MFFFSSGPLFVADFRENPSHSLGAWITSRELRTLLGHAKWNAFALRGADSGLLWVRSPRWPPVQRPSLPLWLLRLETFFMPFLGPSLIICLFLDPLCLLVRSLVPKKLAWHVEVAGGEAWSGLDLWLPPHDPAWAALRRRSGRPLGPTGHSLWHSPLRPEFEQDHLRPHPDLQSVWFHPPADPLHELTRPRPPAAAFYCLTPRPVHGAWRGGIRDLQGGPSHTQRLLWWNGAALTRCLVVTGKMMDLLLSPCHLLPLPLFLFVAGHAEQGTKKERARMWKWSSSEWFSRGPAWGLSWVSWGSVRAQRPQLSSSGDWALISCFLGAGGHGEGSRQCWRRREPEREARGHSWTSGPEARPRQGESVVCVSGHARQVWQPQRRVCSRWSGGRLPGAQTGWGVDVRSMSTWTPPRPPRHSCRQSRPGWLQYGLRGLQHCCRRELAVAQTSLPTDESLLITHSSTCPWTEKMTEEQSERRTRRREERGCGEGKGNGERWETPQVKSFH